MISRRTIDKVMDSALIEEVVGDFVSLKRRGSSMIGLCPFHNEKSPSFNVLPLGEYSNVLVVVKQEILFVSSWNSRK
jgi:hypothetical protein